MAFTTELCWAPEGASGPSCLNEDYPGSVSKKRVRLRGRDREDSVVFALHLSFINLRDHVT